MSRLAPVLVCAVALLAGCVGEPGPVSVEAAATGSGPAGAGPPPDDPQAPEAAPEPAEASPAAAAQLPPAAVPASLPMAAGTRVAFDARCGSGIGIGPLCPVARLLVEGTPVAGARGPLVLDIRVAWNGSETAGYLLEVVGPEGAALDVQRGFDSRRVMVLDPPSGAYDVRLGGRGAAEAWASLRHAREPQGGVELRPNIVTQIPVTVGIDDCDVHEIVEQQARRCLRLGNGVGNIGDGPLEVHLSSADAALTPVGGGEFVQRIRLADGTFRDAPVGSSEFHASHGHFHYHGFARFSLHPVDEASGLRGEAAAAHHKAGFCFLDWGEMTEDDVDMLDEGQPRASQDCLVPDKGSWSMGITPGYYDFYWAGLTDQYIEVSGVPDGLYELVSTADWSGSLEETDETDNSASMLLRLTGDEVQVLEGRGYYRVPPRGR